MTCAQRRDLMLLYVTDALDASEQAELRAHLAGGCPACAGALAEAQATVGHLPLALNPLEPPASARDKLLSRVAADVSQKRPVARFAWPRIAVAACVGALLASAAFWMVSRNQFDPRSTSALQYVSLNGAEAQPRARGRVFWDQDRNNWHVYVFDMQPPPAGKMYELWFVPRGKPPVPAGRIDVDSTGRGQLMVAVPKDVGPLALAAITDEPAGPLQPAPTGHFQLTGDIK